MTRIVPAERKCAVCGETNRYRILASSNTFGGGPDLDTRPPEMYRSTMHVWIHECPKCGYISGDVTDETDVTKEWLQSAKYRMCDGISFVSDLAKRFYKYYLIKLEEQNTEDAFFAVLHAAWACDDKHDRENAKQCRKLAISLATSLIEEENENKDNYQLMRADLMRRAGQFDEMISLYESVHFTEDLFNQILDFELEKARAGDTARYRIEDVAQKR